MKKLRFAMIVLFLATLVATVVLFNISKPRLLVLHSYDKEYAWTREVDVGINRALKGMNDNSVHYSVRRFYMDAKRHPWTEFKVNSGKAVMKLIDSWKPEVVIAVDDDAQEYAMKYYANRPDVKIVFSGMNDTTATYGYDKANNVTGILERKPLQALKETLSILSATQADRRRPLRIMFFSDDSESVRLDEAEILKFDWKPIEIVESRFAKTFDEWKEGIDFAAKNKVDYIITSNYRKILRTKDDKELVPAKEVIKWTVANSTVPIIGTNAFFVEDGGPLAIGTSPYEQGEVALAMANDILVNGKSTQSMPIQSTRQFVVAMRGSGIKKWNIKLPAVYEAAARTSANYYP